jgi:hypothetical protein
MMGVVNGRSDMNEYEQQAAQKYENIQYLCKI